MSIFKEAVRRDLRLSHSPMVLWDYYMEWRALTNNAVPRPLFQNQVLTPHEATFGSQCDISKICQFTWYQWVYFRNPNSFTETKECLGRFLGPVKNEGSEMTKTVLTLKSTIVLCRSLSTLTTTEKKRNETCQADALHKLHQIQTWRFQDQVFKNIAC